MTVDQIAATVTALNNMESYVERLRYDLNTKELVMDYWAKRRNYNATGRAASACAALAAELAVVEQRIETLRSQVNEAA